MEAHTDKIREEAWDVVRIVGPHRTTAVIAADPRSERKAVHNTRTAGGRAEAGSSREAVVKPNRNGGSQWRIECGACGRFGVDV